MLIDVFLRALSAQITALAFSSVGRPHKFDVTAGSLRFELLCCLQSETGAAELTACASGHLLGRFSRFFNGHCARLAGVDRG
jgi:hypothetical protein